MLMVKSTSSKGQTLSYDFFIASTIFLVIVIIIFGYWTYSMKEIQETQEKEEAFNTLIEASQIWFKEGYPKYWDNETVVEIGLSNDGIINETKLNLLTSMGYQKFLSFMNLGKFNVFYNVTNETSIVFQFGNPPSQQANDIYQMKRVGILNGQAVKIKTILWD